LPWQCPLTDRETNPKLNIYIDMSTNPENLMKIDTVVSEISLLQAVVKKEERTKKESNRSKT